MKRISVPGAISYLAACCALAFFLSSCATPAKVATSRVRDKALRHNQRGLDYFDSGRPEAARKEFESALRLNRSIDHRAGAVVNLLNMARTLLSQDRIDEAGKTLDEALPLAVSAGDKALIAEAWATAGKYRLHLKEYDKALDLALKSVGLDRSSGSKSIGGKLNLLGSVYMKMGNNVEALKSFREGLEQGSRYGDDVETANAHRGIGEALAGQGRWEDARTSLLSALELDKQTGNSGRISMDLSMLGDISMGKGAYDEAIDYFVRAYQVDLNSGNEPGAVRSLDSIIRAFMESGNEGGGRLYEEEKERLTGDRR